MSEQPQPEQRVEEPFEPIEVLIEFPEQEGRMQASLGDRFGVMRAESEKAMNLAMGAIRSMAYKVSRTVRLLEHETRPDEVEVGFSLKIDLEAGTVVPVVAQTTVGGQFSVKFLWKLEKPEQVKVMVSQNV
ncbi:MAG: hypothetical protein MUC85_10370 [Anaerolineales bacterium]|jgi:hypothetical protein|nr:hypothetical protein [Anaerolineales bacterium]